MNINVYILRAPGMHEHGQREHIADAAGHRLASTHERYNGRLAFVLELVAGGRVAQDVRDPTLFEAEQAG